MLIVLFLHIFKASAPGSHLRAIFAFVYFINNVQSLFIYFNLVITIFQFFFFNKKKSIIFQIADFSDSYLALYYGLRYMALERWDFALKKTSQTVLLLNRNQIDPFLKRLVTGDEK